MPGTHLAHGTGVALAGVTTNFGQGSISTTGRDTDLAITVELLPTVEGNALCPIAP